MAILGIDDFKSKLTGGGARPNLFKATCNFPGFAQGDVELTSFLCKGVSIPASTIGSFEVPFRGRKLNIAGDRTFAPISLTIINENTGLVDMNDYTADIVVEQLDKAGEVTKKYDFRGCWPTSLAEIALSYDSSDAIEEFTVELQVQYWESDTTS